MDINDVLKEKFGFSEFRSGQKEIIQDILDGRDVLAMLPTGTGKSLCYQLPSYLLAGAVVVVSPLLSLMEDQVEQLKKNGEKRVVAINSFLHPAEKRRILASIHRYKLIYLSPESLQASQIVRALQNMNISLFVVDEAHCISMWGHEFRTDYLKLAKIRGELGNPTCLALTATATNRTKADIVDKLRLNNPVIHAQTIDRPNISINMKELHSNEEKLTELLDCVQRWQGPGIIYTSNRYTTELITQFLKDNGISDAAYYHGGMEYNERLLIQRQFIADQISIICSTNAFGMGVNKSNIRFVIHFHLPSTISSYLQEIGRAGRDFNKSIAMLLYSRGDEEIPLSLIENEFPRYDEMERILLEMSNMDIQANPREMSRTLEMFEVNETVLRFLFYQYEKRKNSQKSLAEMKEEIWKYVESRKKYKKAQVMKMLQIIHLQSCRRIAILNVFDENLENKIEDCCDYCGVNEAAYIKDNQSKEIMARHRRNWQEELKMIFGQV